MAKRVETRVEMLGEYRQKWGDPQGGYAPGSTDIPITAISEEDQKLLDWWLNHPQGSAPMAQDLSWRTIKNLQGMPQQMVTIYRAVPEHAEAINSGDWVTIDAGYADFHKRSMDGMDGVQFKVLSMNVPAGSLYASKRYGNGALDLVALGYHG